MSDKAQELFDGLPDAPTLAEIATEEPRYSFTQPICDPCFYYRVTVPEGRIPTRLKIVTKETCCRCGRETYSGIYERVDPKTVPFPTNLKD